MMAEADRMISEEEEVINDVTEQKEKRSKLRIPAGWPAQAMRIATAILGAYVVAYVGGFFSWINVYIYSGQHNIVIMIFAMTLVFLQIPANKKKKDRSVPWYDYLLVLLSLTVNGYLFWDYWAILDTATLSPLQITFGIIDIILVLEMCRRAVGLFLAVMAVFFVMHPLLANYFPSFLHGNAISLERVIGSLYLYPEGIYGSILQLITGLVMVFIIFGAILKASGAGEFFIKLALSVAGTMRGGPAKVAIIGSTLMGMITGSAIANAATIGVLTIPMMMRVGYKPIFAAAVEAVASNGSQIMPPVLGIAAFLMVTFLGVPYRTVMIAAVVPGLLYYFSLMVMVHLEAGRRNLPTMPREEVPKLTKVLKEGWYYLVPVLLLIYLLVIAQYSAQTACVWALLTVIPLSFLNKENRLGIKKLTTVFSQGILATNTLIAVGALGGILVASINITGVGLRMSAGLIEISGGSQFILLTLTAIAAILLGGPLPASATYLLCATLIAPALIQSGLQPVVAHFFILYFGISAMISPPVAMAAFTTASIAGTSFQKTGWYACRLGMLTFIAPYYMVYRPAMLSLNASGFEIFHAIVMVAISIILLCIGQIGYLLKPISWPLRIAVLLAGFAMIPNYWVLDAIAIAILVVLFLWQFLGERVFTPRAAAAPPQ
jgi:TRAP transporter 4TM/12TM fusion protein